MYEAIAAIVRQSGSFVCNSWFGMKFKCLLFKRICCNSIVLIGHEAASKILDLLLSYNEIDVRHKNENFSENLKCFQKQNFLTRTYT